MCHEKSNRIIGLRPIFLFNMSAEIITQELSRRRVALAQQIAAGAQVVDPLTGYIFCREVNHQVNPQILTDSADISLGLFLNQLPDDIRPTKILGVPNRGREFATALGLKGNLSILVSERIEVGRNENNNLAANYDNQEDTVKIRGIPSFTKSGTTFDHIIRGLKPGDRVAVADDFSARGTVTKAYEEALTRLGISPIFVFMIAKDFNELVPPQIGFRETKQRNVAPAFAVVRFTDIKDGRIIATAEDIKI